MEDSPAPSAYPEKDRLHKTRHILMEEELRAMQAEIDQKLRFEQDAVRQQMTELELRHDQEVADLGQRINHLQERIRDLEGALRQQKLDHLTVHKMAVMLSDMALQLMQNQSSTDK